MESSVQPTPPPQPPAARQSPGGFFEALMDTRFDHLITPSLIRFLYVVAMIVLTLGALAVIIGGFAESAGTGIVLLIISAVSGYFIYWSLSRRGWETLSGASDSAD